MALRLLPRYSMRIRLVLPEPREPEAEPEWGSLRLIEVLEGGEEFLEAVTSRLNEIVVKPVGRYAISYVPGRPGARRPPRRI